MSRPSNRSGKASSRSRFRTRRRCRRRSMPTRGCARFSSSSRTKFARSVTRIARESTSRRRGSCCRSCEGPSLLPPVLAFLEHVLDGRLVDHQVGGAVAVQLDAMFVIPLDIAVDFLSVAQHDDHGSLGLHLFLIIKILGVGLLGRRDFLGRSGGTVPVFIPVPISAFDGHVVGAVVIVRVIGTIEGRPDQLAIGEAFLIGGWFGWYGVESIFQIAPPARRAGRICHNTRACDCGYRGVNWSYGITAGQGMTIFCAVTFVQPPDRNAYDTVASTCAPGCLFGSGNAFERSREGVER